MAQRPIAHILGLGSYLPSKILTNKDLESIVDTTDEWIVSRSGIRERRLAERDEYPSDMGAAAAREALKDAGMEVGEVDLILVATMTPDYISPSTASLIQHRLGAIRAAAMDIQAACTGYLYGLSVAKAYVESGMYRNVLLIASEKMSSFIDYTDRSTCVLFGDGATAAVVSTTASGLVIKDIKLGADGSLTDLVIIPGGGSRHPASEESLRDKLHTFKMNGKEVFKQAVRRMGHAIRECLDAAGLSDQDIRWLIPHQANSRIIDTIAKSLELPPERVYMTLEKYGNTSASSVGIALTELVNTQDIQPNEHLLLVAFGGGLTWGAALLTKQAQ